MNKQNIKDDEIQQSSTEDAISEINISDNNNEETKTEVPEESAQPEVQIAGSVTSDNKEDVLHELGDIIKNKAWETKLDKIQATDLLNKCNSENNSRYNKAKEDFCRNRIYMGVGFIEFQKKINSKKEVWKDYVEENFPEIGLRIIQKMQKIAKFPGAENHTRFGFEGLYVLASNLEGKDGDDPIKDFFDKYPFEYSQDKRMSVKKLRVHVKAGLMIENATSLNHTIEFETAKDIVESQVKIDLEKAVIAVDKAAGKLETYLKNEIANSRGNKGKRKESASFKATTTRFHQIISNYIESQKIDSEVNSEQIDKVINDLRVYRELMDY